MTIPRLVGLLMAMTLVGVAVVALRVDQAVHTRRIQVHQNQLIELRQQLWELEVAVATLRSPTVIRERAEGFGSPAGTGGGSGVQISSGRR